MARLVFILLVLTCFGYSRCLDCKKEFSNCENQMLEEIKSYKFKQADEVYYGVCSGNGTYLKFVNCLRKLAVGQCNYKNLKWCDSRQIKFTSYRFTWKTSMLHDICYRTIPVLDQDFFKNEKCISKVINTPNWRCDMIHNQIRSNTITDKEMICKHWEQYRSCIYDEVVRHCGEFVGKLGDFLFHTYYGYFSKYSNCNFSGETSTKCFFESMFPTTDMSTVPSTNPSKTTVSVSVTPSSPSTATVESTTTKNIQMTEMSSTFSHPTEANDREVVDEPKRNTNNNEPETVSEVNSEKVLQNDSVYKPPPNDVESGTIESNVIDEDRYHMTLARESKAISSKTLGGEHGAEDELQLTHSARSTEDYTSDACHPVRFLFTSLTILFLSSLFSSNISLFMLL